MKSEPLDLLIAKYRDAAWRHGHRKTPKAINKAADEIAQIYRELRRRGPEATARLLPLLSDEDDSVRGCAAAHALEFSPEKGEPVLEELAAGKPGAINMESYMTLKLWREGRLKFI